MQLNSETRRGDYGYRRQTFAVSIVGIRFAHFAPEGIRPRISSTLIEMRTVR